MDMIEKVARAIYAEIEKQDQWIRMPDNNQSMDSVQIDGWVDVLSVARAAIEAMREPTEEMVAAARESRPWDEDSYPETADDNSKNTWHAMIDAALNPRTSPQAPSEE